MTTNIRQADQSMRYEKIMLVVIFMVLGVAAWFFLASRPSS
jgi:hypothetical protein